MAFESSIQNTMTSFVDPVRTQILSIVAFFGSPIMAIFLTILVAGAFWLYHYRQISIWIVATQFSGDAVALFVKDFIQRPRPTGQIIKDTGFSYPSGHTFSTAILVLTILFIVVPLLKDQEVQVLVSVLAIIWLGVVAFSRIYLRDHYPTDVIASLLLALTWWTVMRAAYFAYQNRFANYKIKQTNKEKS
ncbi:phosphatidylglycerophosphatase B [Lactobacillus selangorensis]|uniref:Phosphatidylglycerophosphatase B n=2 Tax=Lactobacillus selangorensis TaxID=81857 RepID=A0A0R2G0P9_9LACO|nr:phosphatidylglycerophosphatase B [Lactobacillus selangorensis]KRN31036.1 phosphatidylglycerophosphatase B [Lactobacillus selangorensis]